MLPSPAVDARADPAFAWGTRSALAVASENGNEQLVLELLERGVCRGDKGDGGWGMGDGGWAPVWLARLADRVGEGWARVGSVGPVMVGWLVCTVCVGLADGWVGGWWGGGEGGGWVGATVFCDC